MLDYAAASSIPHTLVDVIKQVKLLKDVDKRINPARQFGAEVLARRWSGEPEDDRGEGFGALDLAADREHLNSLTRADLV